MFNILFRGLTDFQGSMTLFGDIKYELLDELTKTYNLIISISSL